MQLCFYLYFTTLRYITSGDKGISEHVNGLRAIPFTLTAILFAEFLHPRCNINCEFKIKDFSFISQKIECFSMTSYVGCTYVHKQQFNQFQKSEFVKTASSGFEWNRFYSSSENQTYVYFPLIVCEKMDRILVCVSTVCILFK